MNNNLFLILGITVTVVIIVGAIVLLNLRRKRRRKHESAEMADRPEHDLYADRYFEDNHIEPDSAEKPNPLFESPTVNKSVQTPETKTLSPAENIPDSPAKKPPAPPPKKAERKSEMIIVLYVVAQRESGFAGTDLLTVLEDLGLKHGYMNIFHHYGIGEIKVRQAVFSLASMVEPGTFNPQQMLEFSTPGLALFMRLPGPFGGRVAFELMLNNAKKIADWLGGSVEDERHAPLTANTISALRERIANFEQRSPNLSMHKLFS
ncbi:MAG: cell division protein ZipA [Candidatus Parabeggiatoa sp. nov. 2]|nr:MAG: cell division protein ZipA [Beggiatoa sp. 4572_84]RKZ53072.1 MAG: cell division protein ZipA [Gammaproteobacteria bacterium]